MHFSEQKTLQTYQQEIKFIHKKIMLRIIFSISYECDKNTGQPISLKGKSERELFFPSFT